MSYHIDEGDLERQRLLARLLNPFTVPHLKRLAPDGPCRWLDLGCGVGETTGMLARTLAPGSEGTGLDGNLDLLRIARGQDYSPGRVSFRQGDVRHLPFENGAFDFVFARYLLLHLPDPVAAIREMLRVTRPGGTVLAQEPDFSFQCCYPPSPAYERVPEMFRAVFPDPAIGRKLVHLFREAGAGSVRALADIGIEVDASDAKRIYRMSVGAIEAALLARGGITKAQFDDLMDEFRRVEEDPAVVLLANPVVSVWTVV